ncbi:hypothetical protein DVH24_028248 [Malus domestica]|uniref:Uncharacterized protein n=1 Tax=Malus domestica TaxID=3750 RepID=A0A498HG38_MALDO|nr:hypothetical protein DVH24_028248 [Malus domestica]
MFLLLTSTTISCSNYMLSECGECCCWRLKMLMLVALDRSLTLARWVMQVAKWSCQIDGFETSLGMEVIERRQSNGGVR